MTAWLHSRGARWCAVSAFVSPGRAWLAKDLDEVPAVVALRFHRALEDLDSLALELDDGEIYRLRVCLQRETTAPGVWELVAELGVEAPRRRHEA